MWACLSGSRSGHTVYEYSDCGPKAGFFHASIGHAQLQAELLVYNLVLPVQDAYFTWFFETCAVTRQSLVKLCQMGDRKKGLAVPRPYPEETHDVQQLCGHAALQFGDFDAMLTACEAHSTRNGPGTNGTTIDLRDMEPWLILLKIPYSKSPAGKFSQSKSSFVKSIIGRKPKLHTYVIHQAPPCTIHFV